MTPITILQGDCREKLKEIPDKSVQMCCTSPPYWGLRKYLPEGHPDAAREIGQEPTPDAYVETMRAVFAEVWRVLKDDGTVWLNLGDSYSRSPAKGGSGPNGKNENRWGYGLAQSAKQGSSDGKVGRGDRPDTRAGDEGLEPKNLIGIPWRVAFALQADGWYLRNDIIWNKPACMPESVTDRCTKSHEYIFLMSKNAKYFYDAEAIKERASITTIERAEGGTWLNMEERPNKNFPGQADRNRAQMNRELRDKLLAGETVMANKRDVWTVNSASYSEAHFATFPPDLIKPCILAGTKPGDVVLDPFFGSGTTGMVALKYGRQCIGIELNESYVQLCQERCNVTSGLQL